MEEITHEETGQKQKKLVERVDVIEPLIKVGNGRFLFIKGKIQIDEEGGDGEQVKGELAFFGQDNEDGEEQIKDQFVTDRPCTWCYVSVAIGYGKKPCQVIEQPGIRRDDIAHEHGQKGNDPEQGEDPDEPVEKKVAEIMPVELYPVEVDVK